MLAIMKDLHAAQDANNSIWPKCKFCMQGEPRHCRFSGLYKVGQLRWFEVCVERIVYNVGIRFRTQFEPGNICYRSPQCIFLTIEEA